MEVIMSRTIEDAKRDLLQEIYRIHGNNYTMVIVKKYADEMVAIANGENSKHIKDSTELSGGHLW